MSKGGILLKSGSALIRMLEFLCAALILGIFSYFLAYLKHHHEHIPTWMRAVEGISGAAALYTLIAVILVCFLGGITFFAFLGLLLDILFCGAFVAIAVLARGGARKCNGARSPLGNNRIRDCRFERGAFAVAVVGAFLFLLSAAMAFLLNRQHKKDKKFGPSPSNNYTSGAGKKAPFWKRKNKKATKDIELGTAGAIGTGAVIAEEKHHHNHNHAMRPSHDTAMTGSTAAPLDGAYGGPNNKYHEQQTTPIITPEPRSHNTSGHGHGHDGTLEPGYETQTTSSRSHTVIHESTPYAEVHHGGVPHSDHHRDESGLAPSRY